MMHPRLTPPPSGRATAQHSHSPLSLSLSLSLCLCLSLSLSLSLSVPFSLFHSLSLSFTWHSHRARLLRRASDAQLPEVVAAPALDPATRHDRASVPPPSPPKSMAVAERPGEMGGGVLLSLSLSLPSHLLFSLSISPSFPPSLPPTLLSLSTPSTSIPSITGRRAPGRRTMCQLLGIS
jgi:hypothetical protein